LRKSRRYQKPPRTSEDITIRKGMPEPPVRGLLFDSLWRFWLLTKFVVKLAGLRKARARRIAVQSVAEKTGRQNARAALGNNLI